ncbi:hemagglutinin repeat-containing protein [Histophilus somni]|uniref:hemagglutinin repeat-containing protein n=1 Tax=Histophilus somni TaxID=731 RepID=UPI000A4DB2AE|nr:hemagglutinin repeat-containing protein [Histophilus somni]
MQNALAVAKQAEQVGESKHSRINAMAAANTAWSAYRAGQGLMQASQSLSQMANGNMAQGANVSVSITYGEQKNVQTTDIQGNTAANSAINAGGKVTVTATGAGKESDIHIVGSDVSGQQGTLLQAEDEINVLTAKQTHQERSQNKSAGFNAGVAVSYGSNGLAFGFTAGGNYGKGYGNGDETTYRHSHIGDKGSQTHIMSGGDTTLRGAQVRGKGVQVQAQNLNIESLQDTMTYKGKQMNVSGQVTVGYGFSASANFNQSKINADYASVQEQSGIYAGDEGYQINIAQHTDLKGGLITSTENAETENRNQFSTDTFTYSDIQNHADYKGSSIGLSGSMAINFDTPLGKYGQVQSNKQAVNDKGEKLYIDSQGKQTTTSRDSAGNANQAKLAKGLDSLTGTTSFGFGYDKESQSSVTKSGINTQNLIIRDEQGQLAKTGKTIETTRGEISTNITTDSAEQHTGKLAQNFDKERLQKELDLQREVTQKFDQTRQEVKAELYDIVDEKREKATQIRKINGGYDTELSAQLDREATDLDEKVRWLDMGLGLLQGSVGNSKTMLGVFAGTQADRAVRSATAPKEMWYHKKVINEKTGKVKLESRQIWSLNDLSREELASIQDTNGKVITVSNPGIFNDREDSLSNAEKQNLNSTNSSGVIVVMNPPTGNYKGWWILSSMVSELMYVGYDQLNNKVFQGYLPKTNSEKLNQDIYREVQKMGNGWSVDTDDHSRGGITASVALKDWVNNKEQNGIAPIRKARFYGTATNVQNDYADVLQKNGYTYTGEDGKTYNSGAYSIVHDKDFVGNKWIPFLLGTNDTTKGNCGIFCYSHSSYFAEVPEQHQRDASGEYVIRDGKKVETEAWKDYKSIWGEPTEKDENGKYINKYIPKLINPNKPNGEKYEKNPF